MGLSEDGTLSCLYAGFPVAGLPSCGSLQNGGQTLLLNRACRPQSVVLGLGRVPDVNSGGNDGLLHVTPRAVSQHSLTHSLTDSLIHSLIHSLTHSSYPKYPKREISPP